MYTLRDDQQEAKQDIRKAFMAGNRCVVLTLPTGGGKTVIAADIITSTVGRDRKVLMLAHTRELVHQASEKLSENGIRHGVIMAGEALERADFAAPVQVASKDTLYSRSVRKGVLTPPPADLVIVDECDLSVSKTWRAIIDMYPEAHVLGLTATPSRADGRGLGDIYDSMVIGGTYAALIADGALVPTRVFAPSGLDLGDLRKSGHDWTKKQMAEIGDRMCKPQLVGSIWEHWYEHCSGRQTVVFASGIRHSMALADMFKEHGIDAEHIDGEMDKEERDHVIWRFKRDEIQVLSNAMVLTRGWDSPSCSCAIIARPTRSLTLYRQMAGRVQRPSPGKKDAVILDHTGCSAIHGLPDDDIEWILTKSRVVKDRKKAVLEKLIICKQCNFVFQARRFCPNCGAPVPVKTAKLIKAKPGQLVEVQRRQRLSKATPEEKQATWNEAMGVAMNRNLKIGAAAHIYRQRYGVFPRGVRHLPQGKAQWAMKAREYYWAHVKGTPLHAS